MRKYVDEVKDSSLNKVEEDFTLGIGKEEGSVEGYNYQGTTGGKFVFSRKDPNSFNELFLED